MRHQHPLQASLWSGLASPEQSAAVRPHLHNQATCSAQATLSFMAERWRGTPRKKADLAVEEQCRLGQPASGQKLRRPPLHVPAWWQRWTALQSWHWQVLRCRAERHQRLLQHTSSKPIVPLNNPPSGNLQCPSSAQGRHGRGGGGPPGKTYLAAKVRCLSGQPASGRRVRRPPLHLPAWWQRWPAPQLWRWQAVQCCAEQHQHLLQAHL